MTEQPPREREAGPAPTPATDDPEGPASGFEEEAQGLPAREPEHGGQPETAEAGGDDPPAASASAQVEHDLAELVQKAEMVDELVKRAEERDEYLSLAQRTKADFENYRKRAARDMGAAESRGISKLARELLPALDNLGLALAAAGDGADPKFVEGIRLVHAELLAALARVGIEPFDPSGDRFDPNEHEAMAQQPREGAASGTVVEVYQQGYRVDGEILRPARVIVAA